MKTLLIENTWLAGMDKGWGNGYVVIPVGHPAHGKHYDSIDVEVHGGLTFSELIDEKMLKEWAANHGLTADDIGKWVVGFDTCHYADNQNNWPKDAVQKETDKLAAQIEAMQPDQPTPSSC